MIPDPAHQQTPKQPHLSAHPHTPPSQVRGRINQVVAVLIVASLVLYIGLMSVLFYKQEALLFSPVVTPASQPLAALATQGEGVREFSVDVPGAKLSVLQLKLPNPKGVVFFLHGNRGNLDEWFVNTAIYRQANFDLVMLDYRGFGKSTGHIEMEEQLHADALAVWQHVAPQYAGKKVVIYGRSLGSGLAAELTHTLEKTGQHVDETILVSPYSSMRALVKEKYPFVPISLLCYPLRTDLVLPTLKSPVLLIHGDQDTLIPLSHSQMLQAFNEHSKLLIVKGAGHADIHKFAAYLEGYGAVLKGL